MSRTKHRILVIGVGSIGERHVRCFQKTDRAEIGICEIQNKLRKKVAKEYGIKEVFSDLDAALNSAWDAVLIATPANTHIPIAQKIAEEGIDLLIEKPLSTSIEGVTKLQQTVEKNNLLAAVSYNYRAHPAIRALKAAIDSGDFGRPLQLYIVAGQNFPTYRPAYREIYFTDHAKGGGAIQDSITHLFNLGEWLVGPIDRIAVDAAHQALEGVEVEDTVHALTRQGGTMGSYCMNMYQHPNESSVTVVCEGGTLRFVLQKGRVKWMTDVDGDWTKERYRLKERDDWYILNATTFLNALDGYADPLCTLAEGIQTLRVNLAALESMKSQQWITIGEDA